MKQRREARDAAKLDPGNEALSAEANEKLTQAKRVVKDAKLKAWARECEKMDTSTETARLYATIKTMNGRGRTQESAAAIKTETKTAKTNKQKATVLAKHYAKVSKSINVSASRVLRNQMKARRLMVGSAKNMSCAQNQSCRGRVCRPYTRLSSLWPWQT